MRVRVPEKFRPVLIGAAGGILVLWAAAAVIHGTGSAAFCMSCHEMRVVGEQGWMHSSHYNNTGGVVAECGDCHIPPGLAAMLWTKARDGTKDVAVHLFGESDPARMDWDDLRAVARRKVPDSACRTCHQNLVPAGVSIKHIIAHRAYERGRGSKKCTDCHTKGLHGRYRDMLPSAAQQRERRFR